MRQITKRLLPGQDLRKEIENLVKINNIKAGVVLSLVGCLDKMILRVADGKTVKEWDQKFEIVSATGTLSEQDCHIHLAASNQDGATYGGHIKYGCMVGTTVEIVILVFNDVTYKRAPDLKTGYDELLVV